MGQPLRIVKDRQIAPGVVRFEVDRSLTGTGHETYALAPPESADRTCDLLARKLFEAGDVTRVHIFSNVAEVTFGTGDSEHELVQMRQAIEALFIYYLPGIEPTQIPAAVVSPVPTETSPTA